MSEIVLKRYNSDTREKEEIGKISTSDLARSIDAEEMAEIMDDFCNYGMRGYEAGVRVGEKCQRKHRTIQAEIIRFSLGVILGMSDGVKYTDARNERPIEMGKRLKEMIDAGELNMGYLI